MNIVRTGVILNTEKYDECLKFYGELFGLQVMFQEQRDDYRLTCFEYGGSYLMVETASVANSEGKTVQEKGSKLRFNVSDIEEALEKLNRYGVDAHIVENPWGRTIDLSDPDGNRIGIRDEATFRGGAGG